MLEIKDSVAVITGGGGGIGLILAKYLVQNGGKVLNGEVVTVACNVTKEEDCAWVPRVRLRFFSLLFTKLKEQ